MTNSGGVRANEGWGPSGRLLGADDPVAEPMVSLQRALDAALFCTELTALCAREPLAARADLARQASRVVREPELRRGLEQAVSLSGWQEAERGARHHDALIGTLAVAVWAFVKAGHCTEAAILAAIGAGEHSGRAGALVSGWLTVLHGTPRALSPATEQAA